jgi:hypothetical protein
MKISLKRIFFPVLCDLEDITITDEEIMFNNTVALAQELKGTDINTPEKIQEYINKKYEGDSKM